jgi:multidrug efflux pump subunit AcrA (membrane-fusion protein)
MKQLMTAIIVLFLLGGCNQKQEDQAAHDAKVAQQAREALLKELKVQEEAKRKAQEEAKRKAQIERQKQNRLSQVGIETMPDGKIIIDVNRTKSFFQKLASRIKHKTDKLAKEMERGIIEEKEAGIEINETHIEIDLNKTESFLEKWSRKMEEFAKEFDKIADQLDQTENKGH